MPSTFLKTGSMPSKVVNIFTRRNSPLPGKGWISH